jgi:hypothetical protein
VIDDFDPARAAQAVRNLANPAPVIAVSARRTPRLEAWLDWLRREAVSACIGKSDASGSRRHHEHRESMAR